MMAWLRIDDGFPEHRKLLALRRTERWAWVELMCYCARQQDMGYVPEGISDILKGITPKQLNRYVEVGLLDETDDGYRIHDWHEYNPKDPTGPARQQRYRQRHRNDEVTENVTDSVTEASVTNVTPPARAGARGPSPTPTATTPTTPKDAVGGLEIDSILKAVEA